jgi:putative ABC transport system permease protein
MRDMFVNYFKIAWRNLMKRKTFSFINIFGLAATLTCCMLISVYLRYEWSYDSYQKDVGDMYQVATEFKITTGKSFTLAATPAPMAAAIERELPEVRESTRILQLAIFEDKTMLQYTVPGAAPLSFYEDKGFLADSNFFRFFTYVFLEGDPATALVPPTTIVISEGIAHKLFGNSPALGKTIRVSSSTNGDHVFVVSGVFRPLDAPSHIDANFILSMHGGDMEEQIKRAAQDYTTNNMFVTYLRLRTGVSASAVEAKLPALLNKYAGDALKVVGAEERQFLVPVGDIHLRGDLPGNVTTPASRTSLYMLASIAVFTLLIACINYMNLATARSAKRSSEVGVRKVLGAVRGLLICQFLGESVLMSVFAFLLAWMFTVMLLPAFCEITGRSLSLRLPAHLPLVAAFLGLAVLAGLFAGVYPAFYLSSFEPARVLKGKYSNSLAAISLRKALVVFQFVVSVTLIVSTVVINDQLHFLRTQDLGFDKTAQIVVPLRGSMAKERSATLEDEFRRIGQVKDVGIAAYYPGLVNPSDNNFYRDGMSPKEGQRIRLNDVDYSYLSTMGIKVVAGRIFSKAFPGDTLDRIVLNESAVKALGFTGPAEVVGTNVNNDFRGKTTKRMVVGVVKDFHFQDLHEPIAPYGFLLSAGSGGYLIVHARPGTPAPLLTSLETAWKKVDPNEPFEYSFLDEDFQKNYAADERLSELIGYFTLMAILISCLGLFGLASFSAEQRVREIAIRKVLGASVGSIVLMLTKDFMKLVGLGMLIASPLAWLIMHQWLEDFAYKAPISWMAFLITFVVTIAITLATVSFHAIRAGLANPAESLKAD